MIQPHDSLIVRKVTKLVTALIQVYALYVLFHGHTSPGGGFQAGAILSGSLILTALSQGGSSWRIIYEHRAIIWAAIGLAIYAGAGLICLWKGGEYLNYSFLPLPSSESMARYMGILIVEIGVCIAVTASLTFIFYSLLWQVPEKNDEKRS